MNYTITLIISISIILLSAIGIWTGFFEDIGRGFNNLHTLYINSSDSSPDGGIVEDTVQNDDPEDSALAVDETFDEVLATITAYTSSVEETDNTPCLSASGYDLCLTAGIWVNDDQEFFDDTQFIACPKRYPFKTIVEIPITVIKCFPKLDRHSDSLYQDSIDNCRDVIEYKKYICLDRMSSRYDGEERFDIYMGGPENRQKALNWGVQKKLIKIYENSN